MHEVVFRLWISAVVGAFAIGACVEPNLADNPRNVCAISLQFHDQDGREAFLVDNAPTLATGAKQTRLFAFTDDGNPRSVEILAVGPECAGADARLRIDDRAVEARTVGTLETSMAQARVQAQLRRQQNERFVWRCIVKTEHRGFMLGIAQVTAYVGLRTPQIEQADDTLYVATQDDCEITATLVLVALKEAEGRGTAVEGLELCRNQSLQQCGYPLGIVLN